VVESTREIRVAGEGSGLGAVAGGVVGGLLGNRVGAGRGRTAATVLGAVGGGYAGNAIEKSSRTGMQYQLAVRFQDGTTQTFTRSEPWPFGSGDRVKVVNGQVVRD
jgi:outer membrane lipoprotein SlyB